MSAIHVGAYLNGGELQFVNHHLDLEYTRHHEDMNLEHYKVFTNLAEFQICLDIIYGIYECFNLKDKYETLFL